MSLDTSFKIFSYLILKKYVAIIIKNESGNNFNCSKYNVLVI